MGLFGDIWDGVRSVGDTVLSNASVIPGVGDVIETGYKVADGIVSGGSERETRSSGRSTQHQMQSNYWGGQIDLPDGGGIRFGDGEYMGGAPMDTTTLALFGAAGLAALYFITQD